MPISTSHSYAKDLQQYQQWKVSATLEVAYQVIESGGVLDVDHSPLLHLGHEEEAGCLGHEDVGRRLVFVDAEVYRFHSEPIHQFFDIRARGSSIVPIDASEKMKNLQLVTHAVQHMTTFGISRRSEPVIAIGGGCLMDVIGFAASIYRRHIPYIRVPTTLLGLVDASIGVKTGVNVGIHKNRIGTYCPPVAAILDPSFLATLPRRHIRNGLAEILKMAIVADASLFDLMESQARGLVEGCILGSGTSQTMMRMAIQRMLEELESNLWERELYRIVDFGHTFSPVLEMLRMDQLLHGEAVAIDMSIATMIAANRRLIDQATADRIIHLTQQLGLPIINDDCHAATLEQALCDAVRHRDGLQRMPVPAGIGKAVFLNDVQVDEAVQACKALRSRIESFAEAQ